MYNHTTCERQFWGRYLKDSPKTHYDPFQTFIENNIPKGFRVNFYLPEMIAQENNILILTYQIMKKKLQKQK